MGYKNKEAQKEYQRNWMANKRKEILANKHCAHCSSKEDLVFVDVKSNGKTFSLSYKTEKLQAKINNALILCDPCYITYDKERKSKAQTKHGHAASNSATYISWRAMIERCFNPAKDNYKWYGGRGITVCERWEKFENFLEDMGERPSNMTLDREDPFGNYEKNNCRWATNAQQGANKRKNLCGKI